VICFIALITFAILGIFSAKYRAYAKEAFDCVFRRLTLRKCNTAFDKKMRMKASTKLMKVNKGLGSFVFKYFEAIGWIFTLLLVVSLAYSSIAVYNLAVYGTCDPHSPEICVFTPNAAGPSCGSEACGERGCDCDTHPEGCTAPEFAACIGDCVCEEQVCG